MSSSKQFVEFVSESIGGAGDVRVKPMFGEYGVYLDEKFIAVICDDTFYVKNTVAGRGALESALSGTPELGSPYPGAKPHLVVSGDVLESPEVVHAVLRETWAQLPVPKPKRPKAKA